MFFGSFEKGPPSLEEFNLVLMSLARTDVIGFLAHQCERPMAALRHKGMPGFCAGGELAATGVANGAVLRRRGWFDPGLIHSSAESLH